MQQRFFSVLVMAIASLFFFSSCKKTNKLGLQIPKDASMVIHLNGESLNAKLPWEEVKKSEIFTQVTKDTSVSSLMKAALDNPENTGVDPKNDLVIFLKKDSLGGYVAIEGIIKDVTKFKQFAEQAIAGATSSEKNSIQFLAKEKSTISWNKERFIIVIDFPELSSLQKMPTYGFDEEDAKKPVVYRDGANTALGLYDLKEEKSLGKDEKFSVLMNKKADVHFWFNGEEFQSGSMGMAALGMMNLSKITEGSIFASTANFENGNIVIDATSYSGKDLTEIWKKYGGSKLDDEMIKRVPNKNPTGYFALNFKPEGIREFLKLAGMEGFANMGAGYVGITLDDFIKANKGDIQIFVGDIRVDSNGNPDVDFIFSTSIGDKAAFTKLIDAAKKIGEKEFGTMGDSKIFFNNNDKYFAIGNNKEAVDQYITGAVGAAPEFYSQISGKPSGGYLNFQNLFKLGASKNNMDSVDNEMLKVSMNMWDNVIFKGGEFKDGGVQQHIEVNLKDKSTNSLKSLNNYINQMSVLEKIKKAKQDAAWGPSTWDNQIVDSAVTVTPSK